MTIDELLFKFIGKSSDAQHVPTRMLQASSVTNFKDLSENKSDFRNNWYLYKYRQGIRRMLSDQLSTHSSDNTNTSFTDLALIYYAFVTLRQLNEKNSNESYPVVWNPLNVIVRVNVCEL